MQGSINNSPNSYKDFYHGNAKLNFKSYRIKYFDSMEHTIFSSGQYLIQNTKINNNIFKKIDSWLS